MYAIRSYYETSRLLQHFFHTVHSASSGVEGLDLFDQVTAHIVVTDIQLPEMNGLVITSYSIHYTKLYETPKVTHLLTALTVHSGWHVWYSKKVL